MERNFTVEQIAERLDQKARASEGTPMLSVAYAEAAKMIREHIATNGTYTSMLVAGVAVNHVLAEPRETWGRQVRFRTGETWHPLPPNESFSRKKRSVCFGCLRDTDIVDQQLSRSLGLDYMPIRCDRCGEPMAFTVAKSESARGES